MQNYESSVGKHHQGILHWRELGDGPTLIMLHGLATSGKYYSRPYDVLSQFFRCWVPDLIGFGLSPRPVDQEYSMDFHVSMIEKSMTEAKTKSPYWLVGHSMGSLLALSLASKLPDTRALFCISPPIYRDSDHAMKFLDKLGFMAKWFCVNPKLAQYACKWMCNHRELAANFAVWLRRDLPSEIARDGVEHNWLSYSQSLQNIVVESDSESFIKGIQVPIYLIAGDEDNVMDRQYLEELSTSYPHVGSVFLP